MALDPVRRIPSGRPTDVTPLEALTPPPGWGAPSGSGRAPGAAAPALSLQAAPGSPRLLDRVRHAIRTLHYSRRTETAYVYWIRRFIFHHGIRHPASMGPDEIRSFLSHLAVNEHVSASTQNQALCALVFLYGRVLGRDPQLIEGIERAKRPKRLPVVLTRDEVKAVLAAMSGTPQLVCRVLYGAGLRLLECLTLRVKDVDFGRNELTVRDGKGAKDRVTMLPSSCREDLRTHLAGARRLHGRDLERDLGRAPLPFALAASIPGRTANGAGSTSSPRRRSMLTGRQVCGTATIYTRP